MSDKPVYTVIGSPLSTFTRTVALGLRCKGLEYTHVPTAPHSRIAFSGHPFGYIPALIIHGRNEDEEDVTLCESQAIVRHIDRVAPEPSLHLMPRKGVSFEEKMWEFVSLASTFGLPIIERGVVKARVCAEGKLTEEQILAQLEDGPIEELQRYLKATEGLMAPEGYVFGDKITWADYFLYPMMADLRTVPEWELVGQRLRSWVGTMDSLPEVQATRAGTLEDGAKPAGLIRKNGRVLCTISTA